MLHNIDDKIYHCEYSEKAPDFEVDYILSFKKDQILLYGSSLPLLSDVESNLPEHPLQFLFTISGVGFYLSKAPIEERGNLKYASIQQFRSFSPQWLAFAGVTGYHLFTWYENHKYCGACATPLIHKEDERALVCPHCGHIIYPDIAIAVIIGIVDGDKILFSKYAAGVYQNYALIAGFVEIGETLEDAVKREVYEEVGLRVKNIRYYDNQPWGFSQSMLVGFFADLDGSSEITLDRRELSEATWMARADLPEIDTHVSLTSKMMEAFRLDKLA